MPRRPRTPPRFRANAIGLTLLAHAAGVLLVVLEKSRVPRRTPAPELQYVSFWPEPRQAPAARPVPRTNRLRPAPIAPPALSESPRPAASANDAPPMQPLLDWQAAARQVAAGVARSAGNQETFSRLPTSLRAPCTPRQFDVETKRMMAERLPEPPDPPAVGPDPTANCLVVGGRPMCVQKIIVPLGGRDATDELKENMRTGRKVASVPSAHVCD